MEAWTALDNLRKCDHVVAFSGLIESKSVVNRSLKWYHVDCFRECRRFTLSNNLDHSLFDHT